MSLLLGRQLILWLLLSSVVLQQVQGLSISSSSTDSQTTEVFHHDIVTHSKMDYSNAKVYFRENYGESSYFAHERRVEPIYNARTAPMTLTRHGLGLVTTPTSTTSLPITDWDNVSQLEQHFVPLGRRVLEQAYCISNNDSPPNILDVMFWTPNYRTGPASYVPPVHIDLDFNAYAVAAERGLDDLLEFCLDTRLRSSSNALSLSEWKAAIESGHRFALTNLWCNVGSQPISLAQHPLAIYRPCYSGRSWPSLPQSRPTMDDSKWWVYPDVQPNECVVFCQYDRHVQRPSDAWHAALMDTPSSAQRPRESFDVRCLVLLDEIVPKEHDRWHRSNVVPLVRSRTEDTDDEDEDGLYPWIGV